METHVTVMWLVFAIGLIVCLLGGLRIAVWLLGHLIEAACNWTRPGQLFVSYILARRDFEDYLAAASRWQSCKHCGCVEAAHTDAGCVGSELGNPCACVGAGYSFARAGREAQC